jgi:hypothetical protein
MLHMALPSAYLTSTKNLPGILEAIKKAQAPPRFTTRFLEGLGYSSSADRLIINVLKSLGFLSDTGEPLPRYHEYLDASQSKRVLAQGVRQAYADLFQINTNAQTMTRTDVRNKMKTLSQGQHSESVLDKMASTFKALSERADFAAPGVSDPVLDEVQKQDDGRDHADEKLKDPPRDRVGVNGLVYSINIHLPESRDPAVYDALFRSLREHLL